MKFDNAAKALHVTDLQALLAQAQSFETTDALEETIATLTQQLADSQQALVASQEALAAAQETIGQQEGTINFLLEGRDALQLKVNNSRVAADAAVVAAQATVSTLAD